MQVEINGRPIKVSWQQIVLATVLTLGGFTTGATYPDMNPINLMSSSCDG
jgi:hypothetical protein